MDEKKVQEIFADEAFVKSLFEMETPEDVQSALKGKGLEVSIDEIYKLREQLISPNASADGELSDDDLKDVAGGWGTEEENGWYIHMREKMRESMKEGTEIGANRVPARTSCWIIDPNK